jgi:hypothetical protein
MELDFIFTFLQLLGRNTHSLGYIHRLDAQQNCLLQLVHVKSDFPSGTTTRRRSADCRRLAKPRLHGCFALFDLDDVGGAASCGGGIGRRASSTACFNTDFPPSP